MAQNDGEITLNWAASAWPNRHKWSASLGHHGVVPAGRRMQLLTCEPHAAPVGTEVML